jgi:transposase
MTSKKIRAKIVVDYTAGKGASNISKEYGVSRKTVYNLVNLQRSSGNLDTKMQNVGRKPALDCTALEQLKELILSRPDITLGEIKEDMGLDICLSAIHRIIKGKLGFTYKKRQYMPANETDLA